MASIRLGSILVLVALQCLSLVESQDTARAKCPPRCIRLDNGGCQCYSMNEVRHDNIREICHRRNGKVALFNTNKTVNMARYMQTNVLTVGYWMGIRRASSNEDFYYQDKRGGPGKEVLNKNSHMWADNGISPNDDANCVIMAVVRSDLKFESYPCPERDVLNFFICQSRKTNSTCPPRFKDVSNTKCVRVFTGRKVSQPMANRTCIQHGHELATARTLQELNNIASVVRKSWDWNYLKESFLMNTPVQHPYALPKLWAGAFGIPVNGRVQHRKTEDNKTVTFEGVTWAPNPELGPNGANEQRTCVSVENKLDHVLCTKQETYACNLPVQTA